MTGAQGEPGGKPRQGKRSRDRALEKKKGKHRNQRERERERRKMKQKTGKEWTEGLQREACFCPTPGLRPGPKKEGKKGRAFGSSVAWNLLFLVVSMIWLVAY